MSTSQQQGSRLKLHRKAKEVPSGTGTATSGNQAGNFVACSRKGKKRLSPLQPAPPPASKEIGLPADVWFMIAERAHPYSLLQLSRTNKSFHRIFTSKELSSAIWNQAFRKLENFPDFRSAHFSGPSLAAFIYEDWCAVCKRGGTDTESYSKKIRLHTEGCGDKLIMQGRKMLLKIPAIREEVFLCIPKAFNWNDSSWDVKSRQYGCEFVVDEARKVNFDLHDHLSSSDSQHEAAAISTFVQEHKSRADADEADGEKLDTWMVEEILLKCWSRVADAIFEHHCQNSTIEMGSCHELVEDFVEDNWEFEFCAKMLSEEGWNELYYHMEKLFLSQHYDSISKNQRQWTVERRQNLHDKYRIFKNTYRRYPPFSVFTELPSIRRYWDSSEACDLDFDDTDSTDHLKWNDHIRSADEWIDTSLARLLSRSLAQIGKPLSPDLYSSLHPKDYLLPPPAFGGINDSSNTTGFLLWDPATISRTQLEELLDRFSNQAWFFDSQQPRTLAVTLRDNLDRISKIDYRGPLFPKFHKFWHQILSQVLEKSGIEDGAQGEVTQKLEDLGSCFSCGACGVDGEETGLMTAIELLKHFKDHGFPAEGTPQDSLIVYHPLEAQENDEGRDPR